MARFRNEPPGVDDDAPLEPFGAGARARLADGRELFRLPGRLEERARRIARLADRSLFGVIDGGVDADGPWLVRASPKSLDEDGDVDPVVLLVRIADALAACEAEALFPGPLVPSAVGSDRGLPFLRAEALLHAWLGATSPAAAREGGSKWDSPEVADGGRHDAASNRYALGLLVYRSIAGAHPFAGLGMRRGRSAAEAGPAPFDDAAAARLPPGIQSLVLDLLAPRLEDRPPSADAVLARAKRAISARTALAPSASGSGAARAEAPAPERARARSAPAPSVPRSPLGRVWALAPAAAGITVAIATLAMPRRGDDVTHAPHAGAVAPLAKSRASDCAPCHAREVAEWERSVMAHAAKSPLFGALESAIEEQNGRDARCPNGAGFLRKAGADVCRDESSGLVATGSGGEHWCVRCHAPKESAEVPPWSAFGNAKGRAPLVDVLDAPALEGISCAACHETTGPVGAHGTTSGYEGNPTWLSARTGQIFGSRPEDREGRLGIGNSGYKLDPGALLGAAVGGPARVHLSSSESARTFRRSSEFCGTCHDVRLFGTDVVGKDRGEHFKRLRNGYSEWRAWADHEASLGRRAATCQDCHMSLFPGVCEAGPPRVDAEKNAACPAGTHFAARAPGEYPRGLVATGSAAETPIFSHTFTSVDVPLTPSFPSSFADERGLDARGVPLGLRARRDLLLSRTFRFALLPGKRVGATLEIPIELENVGAGHRVPAGFSQEREVWVELRVEDARGNVVYEVGKIDKKDEDLRDKHFVAVNVRDVVGEPSFARRGIDDPLGRPLGVFGADVVDGPDAPAWAPNPRGGGTRFRGRGLVNLQNGFLRCVKCIGFVDGSGKCQPGPGQGRTRADRYDDAPYDVDTGECRSNLRDGEELFETYFPIGSLDATRGVLKAPDAIVDTRSAPPGVPISYTFVVDPGARPGPFRVSAKLRFRSFPPFLVRAFAAYEAEHAARGERPSGPQVTPAMLDRIDVVDLAVAEGRIE